MLRGRLFAAYSSKARRVVLTCERQEFGNSGVTNVAYCSSPFGALDYDLGLGCWSARRSSVRGITRRRDPAPLTETVP